MTFLVFKTEKSWEIYPINLTIRFILTLGLKGLWMEGSDEIVFFLPLLFIFFLLLFSFIVFKPSRLNWVDWLAQSLVGRKSYSVTLSSPSLYLPPETPGTDCRGPGLLPQRCSSVAGRAGSQMPGPDWLSVLGQLLTLSEPEVFCCRLDQKSLCFVPLFIFNTWIFYCGHEWSITNNNRLNKQRKPSHCGIPFFDTAPPAFVVLAQALLLARIGSAAVCHLQSRPLLIPLRFQLHQKSFQGAEKQSWDWHSKVNSRDCVFPFDFQIRTST